MNNEASNRPTAHSLLISKLIVCATTTMISFGGSPALSENIKNLSAYNAPDSFKETLNGIDGSLGISDLIAGQTPSTEDDVWVYFLQSKEELETVTKREQILLSKLFEKSLGGLLTRGRVEGYGEGVSVILVNFSKSDRTVDFIGCLAALDALRAIYSGILFSISEMEEVCSRKVFEGS